jgi:hypothetical protein
MPLSAEQLQRVAGKTFQKNGSLCGRERTRRKTQDARRKTQDAGKGGRFGIYT